MITIFSSLLSIKRLANSIDYITHPVLQEKQVLDGRDGERNDNVVP